MDTQIVYWIGGILISIIGYFLKTTMEDLKSVKQLTIENKSRIDLVDNNHSHLNDRFDLLYDAVKDLTLEIKNLSKELSKKKDI